MGNYSYLKSQFNAAETAQSYDNFPAGVHTVRIVEARVVDGRSGPFVSWTVRGQVDENILTARFSNYLNEKGLGYLKANIYALLGDDKQKFDIELLDEWLTYFTGALASINVKQNGEYLNYYFRETVKPSGAEMPVAQKPQNGGFTEVEDDDLPF